MKKTLSFILILGMLLSVVPFASAEEVAEEGVYAPVEVEENVGQEVEVEEYVPENPVPEDAPTPSPESKETPTCEHTWVKDSTVLYYEETDESHIPYYGYKCSKCGETQAVTGSAEPHSWGSGVLVGYEVKSNTQHVKITRQECSVCAAQRLVETVESHSAPCLSCGYKLGGATSSDSQTVYSMADSDSVLTTNDVSKATYTKSDNTLTVTKGENGSYVPDYTEEKTEGGDTTTISIVRIWNKIANQIKKIVVDSSITRIGDFAFAELESVNEVDIEGSNLNSVEVGDFAFAGDTALENVNVEATNGTLDYDSFTVTEGNTTYEESTAYYGDGSVSVNYKCTNNNVTDQKKMHFENADVSYGCVHTNVVYIAGTDPTETEFGVSEGLYCKDCKTWLVCQYKIYPNGKTVTGTYTFTKIELDTDIGTVLNTTLANKIGSTEKLLDLFKTDLNKLYREEFQSSVSESDRKDMPDSSYAVYAVKETPSVTPKDGIHVFNIPYPQGTSPDAYKFAVVQLQESGTTKQLSTFLTNNGIQVETTSLLPVGVTWMAK